MNNKYRYASEKKLYKYTLSLPPEIKSKFEAVKKLSGKSFNLQALEALKNYYKVNLKKGD